MLEIFYTNTNSQKPWTVRMYMLNEHPNKDNTLIVSSIEAKKILYDPWWSGWRRASQIGTKARGFVCQPIK